MADPIIVAEKRVQAQADLDVECKKLAARVGIEPPAPLMPIPKQADLRELQNIESIVDFVRRVSVKVGSVDGNAVTHWEDQSGNANHATQPNKRAAPKHKS